MTRGPIALRALFAVVLAPLAAGLVVVTYQDAVMTHLPARMAMAADAMSTPVEGGSSEISVTVTVTYAAS